MSEERRILIREVDTDAWIAFAPDASDDIDNRVGVGPTPLDAFAALVAKNAWLAGTEAKA